MFNHTPGTYVHQVTRWIWPRWTWDRRGEGGNNWVTYTHTLSHTHIWLGRAGLWLAIQMVLRLVRDFTQRCLQLKQAVVCVCVCQLDHMFKRNSPCSITGFSFFLKIIFPVRIFTCALMLDPLFVRTNRGSTTCACVCFHASEWETPGRGETVLRMSEWVDLLWGSLIHK